jgi:putative transposase
VTTAGPVAERYPGYAAFIEAGEDEALSRGLRRAESIGRPVGADAFIERLEREAGRPLKAGKRGPAPRAADRGGAGISALSP